MKKILTILFAFLSCAAVAQRPQQTIGNKYNTVRVLGILASDSGYVNGGYPDTATASRSDIAKYPGSQIRVGNTLYLRDTTLTKWIVAGGYGVSASNITVLNDSSISICSTNSCDTFKFTNIVVNNFSVVNDSTILICDGDNTCDTLYITPTQIAKSYVDSAKVVGGAIYYYINGVGYSGGDLPVWVSKAQLDSAANLKVNISDTASMLNPYLRKVDTSSIRGNTKYVLQGYGTKIDSSGANYTVAVDTTLLKDSLYAGKGIKVDTTTYPNHSFLIVDSQYVRDSLLKVQGGTTGQALIKNSNADYDWSWQNVSSGGGTWGTITGTLSDQTDLQTALDAKQATLVSGTNIKTINGNSLLGSGDLTISAGVTQSVISDTLKNYANSGSITTDNVIYSTPISLTVTNHLLTGSFALKSQSAYTIFGNRTSGSAAPNFFVNPFIDSIKLSTDTIYGRINGSWIYQFKSPAFANWLTNGTKIYTLATQVGIGVDTPTAKLTILDNTITSALTNTGGILLTNTTAATVNNPKSSPSVVWESNGWNTNGSGSQNLKFRLGLKPLSGFGIGGYLTLETNRNNAGFNQTVQFGDGGIGPALVVTGNANVSQSLNTGFLISSGSSQFTLSQTVITPITYSTEVVKFNGASSNTNGTNTYNILSGTGTINNTGGTNTLRFLYYNPTVTSTTGTTIIGYQNEVGNNLLNTTSGSTSIGATTTIPASRIFQVVSTTQASSPFPPMTTTQRTALTPSENDGVYDTDLHKAFIYDGTTWNALW